MAFLESLANVLMGETGPYTSIRLLDEQYDPSRSRALLAFSSAKHERIFSLLDQREYDYVEVVVPKGERSRSKVATYAAEIVRLNYPNSDIIPIDTNDLDGLVKHLDEQYMKIYREMGANLELGLTGSKTQALAAAILSARRKVAEVWYVKPSRYDERRFSTGVGQIRIFDIRI